MSKNALTENLHLFEDHPIRTAWSEAEDVWYFSIVDVISVLTESKNPAAYWRKLKQRLKEEGNETVTNCHGFMPAAVCPPVNTKTLRKP